MAEVPPGPVTTISVTPAACGGETATMLVAELALKLVAGVPANVTAVAPVKFVPVIVTVVPPLVLPEVGLTAVTVGTDAAVKV